jgi:outer membrane protein assembly factor BamB
MTKHSIRFSLALFTALMASRSLELCAENWPRFRGPTGQGISTETGLPVEWSETENVAWKTEIPGQGWSSPVVYDDRVFLTTATDEGRSCHVICVDRVSGSMLWNTKVFDQVPRHKRQDNSHATPTAVTDGTMVYAVFSAGGIAAVDMDGNLKWENHDVSFFSQHGLGASPILHDDLLIMPFDGSSDGDDDKVGFKKPWDGAVLLALDKTTGDVRWRGERGLSRLAHVTPQVTERDDTMLLVSAAGDAIQGHNAVTGELIWTVYSQGEGVTPSVVLGSELIYTCSGFEEPTIRVVRFGGEGDVTNSHIAWERKQGVPAMSSLLYVDPYIYSVTDAGILTCFDAASGDQVWRQRIGGRHSCSPIFADGRIYFLSEREAESVVIEAGDEYKEIARNRLDQLCRASMAVSQGNIYIRTEHFLYCIGDAPAAE